MNWDEACEHARERARDVLGSMDIWQNKQTGLYIVMPPESVNTTHRWREKYAWVAWAYWSHRTDAVTIQTERRT
jgi:hypothetical protein